MAAYSFIGCKGVRFFNNAAVDCEVGLEAQDCSGFRMHGNRFDRVSLPVRARRVNGLFATNNCSVSSGFNSVATHFNFRPTFSAMLVRMYLSQFERW